MYQINFRRVKKWTKIIAVQITMQTKIQTTIQTKTQTKTQTTIQTTIQTRTQTTIIKNKKEPHVRGSFFVDMKG